MTYEEREPIAGRPRWVLAADAEGVSKNLSLSYARYSHDNRALTTGRGCNVQTGIIVRYQIVDVTPTCTRARDGVLANRGDDRSLRGSSCVSDQGGVVLLEFLAVFMPLVLLFVGVWQVCELYAAKLVLARATTAAGRAASVVLADNPSLYSNEPVNVFDGAPTRQEDIRFAASSILAASPHFSKDVVVEVGPIPDGQFGKIEVKVTAKLRCDGLRMLCPLKEAMELHETSVHAYSGAAYEYEPIQLNAGASARTSSASNQPGRDCGGDTGGKSASGGTANGGRASGGFGGNTASGNAAGTSASGSGGRYDSICGTPSRDTTGSARPGLVRTVLSRAPGSSTSGSASSSGSSSCPYDQAFNSLIDQQQKGGKCDASAIHASLVDLKNASAAISSVEPANAVSRCPNLFEEAKRARAALTKVKACFKGGKVPQGAEDASRAARANCTCRTLNGSRWVDTELAVGSMECDAETSRMFRGLRGCNLYNGRNDYSCEGCAIELDKRLRDPAAPRLPVPACGQTPTKSSRCQLLRTTGGTLLSPSERGVPSFHAFRSAWATMPEGTTGLIRSRGTQEHPGHTFNVVKRNGKVWFVDATNADAYIYTDGQASLYFKSENASGLDVVLTSRVSDTQAINRVKAALLVPESRDAEFAPQNDGNSDFDSDSDLGSLPSDPGSLPSDPGSLPSDDEAPSDGDCSDEP